MVLMATKAERSERRADALSKGRIVEAALEILDADGESASVRRVDRRVCVAMLSILTYLERCSNNGIAFQ